MLRRNKMDVLDDLPEKTEVTLTIDLSKEELHFYEALRQEALEQLESSKEEDGSQHMQILSHITRLRQASCNPKLIDHNITIESSKMEALSSLVDDLISSNHKMLIFSQFVGHLALVKTMLDAKKIGYQYLDGGCSSRKREEAIDSFQAGESNIFLISLKAGGTGFNLTAADYVIHLDPWWNPAVEDQASDRAHRIGQTRPVTVYRLVAKGTIEEKIVKLHGSKRDLADRLLANTDRSAKISTDQLFNLIYS